MEEEQEVKKRKSTLSLPLDLTTEILSRLPEKSVARFRCVSKQWLSVTTDTYFINMFETRSPRPSLLLCFKEDDTLFVSSISQHHQTHTLQNSNKSYSSSQPIDRFHMKFPDTHRYMRPTESVHGLICFQESGKPIIWNPSKRQFLILPQPRKSWNPITVMLGYDPIEGKHKVVCIPLNRSGDVCRVLTLGSPGESWRTVKTYHKHRSDINTSGHCINGVVYYLAYVYQTRVWFIMSFDVRSEKFDMIQLPSGIHKAALLVTYEGRLACFDVYHTNKKNGITMWILEDAEKHKWSSKDFLVPFGHHDSSFDIISFTLKGITNAGEFIYAPATFRKSFYILFYDPVRNSFRRFELKGIADDECRLNKGVENENMYTALCAFPNHMEIQMSL